MSREDAQRARSSSATPDPAAPAITDLAIGDTQGEPP
jgi:hypothetical protein